MGAELVSTQSGPLGRSIGYESPVSQSHAFSRMLAWPSVSELKWMISAWIIAGIPTLVFPFGRDQGLFAHFGREVLSGKDLYTQLWDVKSPLIYWTYGLAGVLFGGDEVGYRIFDLLFAALNAYLVWNLARAARPNGTGSTGTIAAIIFLFWYYFPNDYRVLANCEVYLLPFLTLSITSVAMILLNPDRPRNDLLKYAFLGGLFIGITPLYKTTAVLLTPAGALALYFIGGASLKKRFGLVGAFAIGVAIPLFLGWLFLAMTSALDEWWYMNFIYLPHYTQLAHVSGPMKSTKEALYFFKDLAFLYPAMAAGALLFLYREVKRRHRLYLMLALYAIIYAGAVVVQGKYVLYHFLPLLPVMAALVAIVTLDVIEDYRASALLKLSAVAVIALSLSHGWRLPERYSDAAKMTFNSEDYRETFFAKLSPGNYACNEIYAVGEYIRDNSTANDQLFVWSFEPELYYISGLSSPNRFVFNTPFLAGEISDPWKAELMQSLNANPPTYFVIGTDDGLPLITGEKYSSAEKMIEVPGLIEIVTRDYEEVKKIGRFIILKRRVFADAGTDSFEMTAEKI